MRASVIRALVLEALFIGTYFLLSRYLHRSGSMPLWLAYGFLAVVLLDVWAIWFKLRAVRFELDEGQPVLPAHLIVMSLMGAVRLAVFGVMVEMAWKTIVGEQMAESSFELLLVALGFKELVVLGILVSARSAKRPVNRRPSAPLVFLSDVVLVFSAEFVLLLLDQLFEKPALDLSWNPIVLVIMTVLFALLFLLFALPFRVLYSFESLKQKDSAVLYEVGSILFMVGSMLWFSFYSSERATEEFLQALRQRTSVHEFVYERPTRLKVKTLERLCELKSLRRLALHCDYPDYLPPCVPGIPGLRELDLEGNDFARIDLYAGKELSTVSLAGNSISSLKDLGVFDAKRPAPFETVDLSNNSIESVVLDRTHFPKLRSLDLSFNPLKTVSVPAGAPEGLSTLRLEGTFLSSAQLEELGARLPNTRIEY